MKKILLINGPNLNNLGNRDKSLYGEITLKKVIKELEIKGSESNLEIVSFQSNHEGEIVDFIQKSYKDSSAIIINAGALSQIGYSILDALIDTRLPYVEIHISNIYSREEFRQKSVLAKNAIGQISGLGIYGYLYALDYLSIHLKTN